MTLWGFALHVLAVLVAAILWKLGGGLWRLLVFLHHY